MTAFQQLPSSVLQAGAIFLSIIIEALPFVLIGSIVSGLIEVYITPDKVYHFLPRNRWGRIFFGTFIGILFPLLLNVESSPLSIVFWKRRSPVTRLFLSCNSTCYQSHCSFCDLFCLWQLLPCRSVTSSRFHCSSCYTWDFSGIFLERTDSERKSFSLS